MGLLKRRSAGGYSSMNAAFPSNRPGIDRLASGPELERAPQLLAAKSTLWFPLRRLH
jgi:hypothetical protein